MDNIPPVAPLDGAGLPPKASSEIENMYWPASTNAAPQSSYTATAQGNTLTALPTPGTGGLSLSQPAGQNNVVNTDQTFPLSATQRTNQYTNTAQVSSYAPPVNSYTYHSITPNSIANPNTTSSFWNQFFA